jgi:hypothetical protein
MVAGRKARSIVVSFLWVTVVQMKAQLEQKPQKVQGWGVGSAGGNADGQLIFGRASGALPSTCRT